MSNIPNVLDILKPTDIPVYYEGGTSGGKYWMPNGKEKWHVVSERAVVRELINAGFQKKTLPGEALSQVEEFLRKVVTERSVEYAGPLAGYDSGYYKILGYDILVTSSPEVPEAMKGDWMVLLKTIECILSAEPVQLDIFHSWMKIAVEALRDGNKRPGQALVMAGPKDCGKSLLQNIITVILGGRMAKPYEYMSGKTRFNGEMTGAEHQQIEDEVAACDIASRRAFGASLKNLLVNSVQRCHPKNKQAMMLTPFWRLTMSVNDEPEDLNVLPPKDDSIWDKIILLLASRNEFPMPTETNEQREAFHKALIDGIPGYLHWLTVEYTIPNEVKDTRRFGVISYHHPELLDAAGEMSPEVRLLRLIDEIHFSGSTEILEGSTEKLEIQIGAWESGRREIANVLRWTGAMKTYLKRLSVSAPDRVKCSGFGHNHKSKWEILPPKNEKE